MRQQLLVIAHHRRSVCVDRRNLSDGQRRATARRAQRTLFFVPRVDDVGTPVRSRPRPTVAA